MTEITRVECYGEVVPVDLDRNGVLTFVGFDFDYARSMQEFGEPVSECERLSQLWLQSPRVFIIYKCRILNLVLLNFAADCIAHYVNIVGADPRAIRILNNAVEAFKNGRPVEG